MSNDEVWMQHALKLARQAAAEKEVPVGAVLVLNNKIMGEGYNQSIHLSDPTAHAEVIALRNAAKVTNNYRLLDSTLYVTLEPCAMCMGALRHARVKRLVYAAADTKTEAVDNAFNHRIDCDGGVLAQESVSLLKNFFIERR
jgi:tRNA(adenine34) deaminase